MLIDYNTTSHKHNIKYQKCQVLLENIQEMINNNWFAINCKLKNITIRTQAHCTDKLAKIIVSWLWCVHCVTRQETVNGYFMSWGK